MFNKRFDHGIRLVVLVLVLVSLLLFHFADVKIPLLKKIDNTPKRVLFPLTFVSDSLQDSYFSITGKKLDISNIEKYFKSDLLVPEVPFRDYNAKLYHSMKDNSNLCSPKNLRLGMAHSQSLDDDLRTIILAQFSVKSKYISTIPQLSKLKFSKELNSPNFSKKWFRFAGLSVFLKDYGVHFMILRVVYSPKSEKNNPLVSLFYVQLFDTNWSELKNYELIFPTGEENEFKSMIFPSFLPIPFYADPEEVKNYGPEDPRITTTINKLGYEEPVIIFNELHRQKKDNGKVFNVRSMFLCYPWQFQTGMSNVDKLAVSDFTYNRVVELKFGTGDRSNAQKNWTPFFDYSERYNNKFDKEIYFVYKWEGFTVYKCSLIDLDDGIVNCHLDYKAPNDDSDSIGALRGGTELVNINQLASENEGAIPQLSELSMSLKLASRQVWFGFARAHLKKCGCFSDMYRPNFVVVVKDTVNGVGKYKINDISSFMSLGVNMKGWDGGKISCNYPNVLIPNGISDWRLMNNPNADSTDWRDSIDDIATLSFSISDMTVEIVQIKGLIKALLNLDKEKPGLFIKGKLSSIGYNNRNVDCAIESSKKFCSDFGDAFKAKEQT